MNEPTIRVTVWQDGFDNYHLGAEETREELEKFGLDIPKDLLDEQTRIDDLWRKNQATIDEWLDSVRPDGETMKSAWDDVVLHKNRTWEQYAKTPNCLHAKAVGALMGQPSSECENCGAHLRWRYERDRETGEYLKTGEILVR